MEAKHQRIIDGTTKQLKNCTWGRHTVRLVNGVSGKDNLETLRRFFSASAWYFQLKKDLSGSTTNLGKFHLERSLRSTVRTNLPKFLDLLIFCIYSLNFSLEFFIMIFFETNQLNISKFLPLQVRKTLISY